MTDAPDDWQKRNDAYLAAALAMVRARLDALLPPPSLSAPAPTTVASAGDPPWRGIFGRSARGDVGAPRILLPSPASNTASADAIGEALTAASGGDPPPALLILAQRFGLSDFERDTLLLAIAPELDTGIAARYAAVQGEASRDHPSFALAMTMFDAPTWAALSPAAPLRHWRLLEVSQPGARTLTASALRADERIVNFAKGLNQLDGRLAALLLPMPPLAGDPPPSQAEAINAIQAQVANKPAATVALAGPDRDSKRAVAVAAAATLGLTLCRLPGDSLPADPTDLETLARLWHRETLLLPVALYLDASDVDVAGADGGMARIGRFLARSGGLVMVDARDPPTLTDAPAVVLDIARPTPGEQAAEWMARLAPAAAAAAGVPTLLAGQFDLSHAAIATIAAAGQRDAGDLSTLPGRLWDLCRARTRPAMARLAEKIDAKARWEDIVLPAPEAAQLREIVAQVRARAQVYDEWGFRDRMNRGLGVSALFAGDSGTGKTMAAEVLATALRLDLYRIDLSAVVSKYIGETEKNLRTVFDAADAGGAVLFFDEADALFGKRSEVKDSHDRYANIEIDYLLQRMEAFAGLAILATNMKSALDPAFTRRLRFIVNFPYPGVAERLAMWERAFPPGVPTDRLDFDRLARLNLSGGNIHSVALSAAFAAAALPERRVTMALVLEAARREFRKLDRPVNEADFRAITAVRARA